MLTWRGNVRPETTQLANLLATDTALLHTQTATGAARGTGVAVHRAPMLSANIAVAAGCCCCGAVVLHPAVLGMAWYCMALLGRSALLI